MEFIEKTNNTNNENNKKDILKADLKIRGPSCGLIVIDNFYNNPYETREYIMKQPFSVKGNYPGQRTISYANQELKEITQALKNTTSSDGLTHEIHHF